ncbi:unnamed protein product [Soboliphyme baturini]|uniref:AH domain-containing protein n=1 Tax=Soboliphyme baturini TaxID=241478 RepID=A0A183IA12_9BILA|nr:unnamed protein product [Soboliphyme baturini]
MFRLEYDAYRSDLTSLQQGERTQMTLAKMAEIEKEVEAKQDRYERYREEVAVKLNFLSENKVKVMQKQLTLFQQSTSAYFAGNKAALESTIKQFAVPRDSSNHSLLSG